MVCRPARLPAGDFSLDGGLPTGSQERHSSLALATQIRVPKEPGAKKVVYPELIAERPPRLAIQSGLMAIPRFAKRHGDEESGFRSIMAASV
jgi:hypothetical protein